MNTDKLSQFETPTYGRVENNAASLYATRSWEEMDEARNQALTEYMAGVTDSLTTTTPKQTPTQTQTTNKDKDMFENYNNALSQVNLIDDTLTPTQTYTDYISSGGTPIPGYESEDATFKQIDNIHRKQQDLDNGLITEDQMLWDLYASDILEASGYKVKSAGWWISKYTSGDYSNLLTNKYLQSTVLDQAREYHNSILAKEYAHKQTVQKSSMSTLLNKGDLSNDDIKTLFPELTKAIDDIDPDADYHKWFVSNKISPDQRIYQDETTGERYYLHSNGELYLLSNKGGEKTISYTEDSNGNITELSFHNNNDVMDALGEFKSGFMSVLTGFEKLTIGLWGATGGYLWDGFTSGDWDFVESVTEELSRVDELHNDKYSHIFNSGRIDMDGFKMGDQKDWLCFLSNMSGMMLGGYVTGGIASKAAGWGTSLVEQGNILGYIPRTVGNLYARSTGLYRGYTGKVSLGIKTTQAAQTSNKVFTLFGKNFGTLAGWAPTFNHAKTVSVYMMKDFNNNLQALNQQYVNYKLRHPDEEITYDSKAILKVAAHNAAFNGAVSMIFAGGIDDNQAERWLSVIAPSKNVETTHLANFLTKYNVGVNVMGEFLDNFVTTYTGNIIEWDPSNDINTMLTKGAYRTDENGNSTADWGLVFKTGVQAAIMTMPELRSQMQRKNIAMDNAELVWKQVMDDLDSKGTTPQSKQAMQNLKADLIDKFNKTEGDIATRVYTVLDNAQGKLMSNKTARTFINESIEKVCNPKMMSVYKKINDINQESYAKSLEHYKNLQVVQTSRGPKAMFIDGAKKTFKDRLNKFKANRFSSLGEAALEQDMVVGQQRSYNPEAFGESLYNAFVASTLSRKSEDAADSLRNRIEVTADELKNVKDIALSYNEFAKTHSKEKQALAQEAAERVAKDYGITTDEVKAVTKYYTFNNGTDNRDYYNSNQAAMLLMTKALPNYFYRVDDYTYGLLGTDSKMTNIFNDATLDKVVLSMHAASKGEIDSAVDLYVKTMLGDDVKIQDLDYKEAKNMINDYLDTGIKYNIFDKQQASEFLLGLREQEGEVFDGVRNLFDTDLTMSNVTSKKLTDLEKYAIIYRAARHLSESNNKRFSGKTIAAEIAIDPENPISVEVIQDLVNKNLVRKDFQTTYYETLMKAQQVDSFKYTTGRFFKDLVEVASEAKVKNLPDSEQDIKPWLQAIIDNKNNTDLVTQRAKQLLDFSKVITKFNNVTYDGNIVTFDLTSYMPDSIFKFIKEVANTEQGSETSRANKPSYNFPSSKESENFLNTMTELANKNSYMVTIDLNKTSDSEISYYADIMFKAGMFTDIISEPPKTVGEFKNILDNDNLTDLGELFVHRNLGLKSNSNIINKKLKEQIKEAKSNVNLNEYNALITKVREIDPKNKVVAQYDLYELMQNNILLNSISVNMSNKRQYNKDKKIFINPIDTTSNKGITVPAYVKKSLNVQEKKGRVSKEGGLKYNAISTQAEAYNVNKDMATKFVLLKMADDLYTADDLDIKIPYKDLMTLSEAGIVDTEDSFYRSESIPSGNISKKDKAYKSYVRLVLKDHSANKMKEYIETNKEINVYKLFPFYSSEKANFSISFNTPGLEGVDDIKGNGLTTYDGIYNLFNVDVEFDNSGAYKKEFWDNFKKGRNDLYFNPYTEDNIPLDINEIKNIINKNPKYYNKFNPENATDSDYYNEYRYGTHVEGEDEIENKIQALDSDEYYALLKNYDELEKSYISKDDKNDDALVWLSEPNVLKRMITYAQNGTEYSDDFAKDIIKTYDSSNNTKNLAPYSSIYDSGVSNFVIGDSTYIPTGINNIDTVMNKTLLDHDTGVSYKLTDNGVTIDSPEIAKAQIKDAYDFVKNNINKFTITEDIINTVATPIDNKFIIFEPSDVTKLAAITGASDDNINIEDLDTLTRMDAEAYRVYYDEILKLPEGTGDKIYKGILDLQKTLLKYSEDEQVKPTISSQEYKTLTNPLSNPQKDSAKHIAVGSELNNKQDLENYINSFINKDRTNNVSMVDKINNDFARLTEKTAEDLINQSTRDEFKDDYIKHNLKISAIDNKDINGNTLLEDVDNDMSLTKRINSARNTYNELETMYKDLGKKIDYKDETIKNNFITLSNTLVDRARGTKYLGTWAQYSFIKDDGTELANAVSNKEYSARYQDLYDTVQKEGTNLIGSTFIKLNKQSATTQDGVSFSYKPINNEDDLVNLKMDLLKNIVSANRKLAGNNKTTAEIMTTLSPKELSSLLTKIKEDNITNAQKVDYNRKLLERTNISKPENVMILPSNYKNDASKNYIAQELTTATPARYSVDPQVRRQQRAINYGIDYTSMDNEHMAAVDETINSLNKKFDNKYSDDFEYLYNDTVAEELNNKHKDRDLTEAEWVRLQKAYGLKNKDDFTVDNRVRALSRYILDNGKESEVLSYTFNKTKTLNQMYDDYHNRGNEVYVCSNNREFMIKDLNDFFTPGINSNIKQVFGFDVETSNIKNINTGNFADSINDVWQIGFDVYTTDKEGNLSIQRVEKFIKHDISPEKWIEENMDLGNNFIENNPDVKQALEDYKNTPEEDMLTPKQVEDILNGNSKYGKHDLVVAYNGDNYEFRIFKKELENQNTLDLIKAVMKNYDDTTKHLDMDSQIKMSISSTYKERHTAGSDADDMMNLFAKLVNTNSFMYKDRYRLIENLEKLNGGAEDFSKVLSGVHKFIYDNATLKKNKQKFNDYEPTLDNIKDLQRSFNFLQNNVDGKLQFYLNKELRLSDPIIRIATSGTEENNNFIDLVSIKMLETDNDYFKARTQMIREFQRSDIQDKATKNLISLLSKKDPNILNILHIDPALANNEQVIENRKNLYNMFRGGMSDVQNVAGINKKEMQKYKDSRLDMGYIVSTEDKLGKLAEQNIPKDVYNTTMNIFGNGMISLDEEADISEIQKSINTTFEYEQKGIQGIINEANNALGKAKGTGTFSGLYSMLIGLRPDVNDVEEIVYKDGKEIHTHNKLTNLKPLDIAITLNTLKNKFNIEDLSEIQGPDGNLYLNTITNPADHLSPSLPVRVRLIEGDELYIGMTPVTEAILRSRDFDGDHTITYKPTEQSLNMSAAINNYFGMPYNILEKLYSNLEYSKYNKKISRDAATNLFIVQDETLRKYSNDIENVIKDYDGIDLDKTAKEKLSVIKDDITNYVKSKLLTNSDDESTNRLKAFFFKKDNKGNYITDSIDDIANDVYKALSYEETYTNTGHISRFVKNPAIWGNENNFSSKSRLAYLARTQLTSSNIGDPTAGFYQKLLSVLGSDPIVVNNPMKDLYTPSIYLTDELSDNINIKVYNKNSLEGYCKDLYKLVSTELNSSDLFTEKSKQKFLSELKDLYNTNVLFELPNKATEEDYAKMARRLTLETVWDLEHATRNSLKVKNTYMKALDELSLDDTFKNQLTASNNLQDKLDKLQKIKSNVGSHASDISPYRDILSQDIILNRINGLSDEEGMRASALNYGGILFNDDDIKFKRENNLAKGWNNVKVLFVNSGLGNPDTIGVNPNTKAHAAIVDIIDMSDWKDKKKFLTKGNTIDGSYKKPITIGTDANDNPIQINSRVHINNVDGDYLIVNYDEPLAGKKLSTIGIAKGNAVNYSLFNKEGKLSNEYDLVVDMNDSLESLKKLSLGLFNTDESNIFKNMQYIELFDNNKKPLSGFVLEMPYNIVGNDKDYKNIMNINDPSNLRHAELMTLDTAQTLLGISRFGSEVISKDRDGNFVIDTSHLKDYAKEHNFSKHLINYNDVGAEIMYQRSSLLAHQFTDDEFLGMVSKITGKTPEFNSVEEYLNNLSKSMFTVNSQEAYNQQLDMIYSLGKDRFQKLVDSSDLAKVLFGYDITNKLNYRIPESFTPEFFKKPRTAHSKNSSQFDFSTEERLDIRGKNVNEIQKKAKNSNITNNLLLHVGADEYYQLLFGYKPNTNSLLRMISRGDMGYQTHYHDSALLDNGFTPVNTKQGISNKDLQGLNIQETNSGRKTNMTTKADLTLNDSPTSGTWQKGAEYDDLVVNTRDDVLGSEYYQGLNKAYDKANRFDSGISSGTVFDFITSSAFDKRSNIEKQMYIRGYDNAVTKKLNYQFTNDNDNMYYKAIINRAESNPRDIYRNINDNTKGYSLRTDLKEDIPNYDMTDSERNKIKDAYKEYQKQENKIVELKQDINKSYDKLRSMIRLDDTNIDKYNPKFTFETSDRVVNWKTNHWTRSGIDDKGIDQLSVDIGIKNYSAGAAQTAFENKEHLNKLRQYVSKIGLQDFQDYYVYRGLSEIAANDNQLYEKVRGLLNVNSEEDFNNLKVKAQQFETKYSDIVSEYNKHIDTMLALSKEASEITNEPFSRNFIYMMPVLSTNKEIKERQIYNTIKNMSSISKYDISNHNNILKQNMVFDFFESSDKMIDDLSTTINSKHLSDALLGEYNGNKALIDNTPVVDKAFEIINDTDVIDKMKPITDFDSDITQKILDTINTYTDIDINSLKRKASNSRELLTYAFNALKYNVEESTLELGDINSGEIRKISLSQAYRYARGDMSNDLDIATRQAYEKLYNNMYAEIVVAQRIIESDPYASSKLNDYIDGLYSMGKTLVNKFGQKIERNGIVVPTDKASFGYLKENLELAFNSRSKDMFNQYVLEKALSGELFVTDKKLADVLEKQVYTSKVPNRVKQALTKVSRFAAGIQMALPAKIAGRLMRFTGTDYAIGSISNPHVLGNIGRANREIYAAVMSKGKNMSPDLKAYLSREGQGALYGTGVDPLDPSINDITNKLTTPFEIQNHLGRYAIYLTAKESFDNNKPWYGSQYYNHEAIDAMKSNEDKAMYVMDYMLGSPGGFPELSKHTSGYLMYATFPMNFGRTLGAYGMSLGKLFQEGVTAENKTQWYNNVVTPSLGMIGLTALSNLVITAVCDMYGVDEDKEEEWKKEGVTLDPIGTLIGDSPSVVYDSINPLFLTKEMFINPFTNEYNDTLPKKGYGWIKANVLSKLNPAIKTPIEITTGKDLWGDNAEGYKTAEGLFEDNKKMQYTNIENGMKKVLGILVGSGVANSVVDQVKMDKYNEDSSFVNSVWNGITKGLSSDLGNQKSWKDNTSNYYALLTDMKNYAKVGKNTYGNTYGNTHYYSIEDMADADVLEASRKYSGRYGVFDKDDYTRVNSMIKKMITNCVPSTELYAYIVKEFNENNVSEATLRSALNSNSIIRKLRTDSMSGYKETLSDSELIRLEKAIAYENEYYPILQLLFPDKDSTKKYLPSYKQLYSGSGSGGSGYPSGYTPRNYTPSTKRYYPSKYYPSTYRFNKKTGKYGPNLKRVQVNVSPQMAIWNQDKNLTQYQTGLDKTNDPQWLRSRDYVSRVYNI